MFCGPETAVVARGEAESNNGGRVIYPGLIPWGRGVSYTGGGAYIRTTFAVSIKFYCTCKLYCEQSPGADPAFWMTGLLDPHKIFKIRASETAFPAFWRHLFN